ncbi:Hypothetical_protein [Hexamita inflata]|uniref:Hypothetical_protein n=1 Tax=Hexamita inflata TaxID=28002 RepID=A0AA86RCC6_9EUKA|nr:Hypothetical protein HINF_LOCUS12182 [Hexamita inflata]CAI9970413.1 Hypothetical protein HINF_LOCUS58058 [Hexamita inflata]
MKLATLFLGYLAVTGLNLIRLVKPTCQIIFAIVFAPLIIVLKTIEYIAKYTFYSQQAKRQKLEQPKQDPPLNKKLNIDYLQNIVRIPNLNLYMSIVDNKVYLYSKDLTIQKCVKTVFNQRIGKPENFFTSLQFQKGKFVNNYETLTVYNPLLHVPVVCNGIIYFQCYDRLYKLNTTTLLPEQVARIPSFQANKYQVSNQLFTVNNQLYFCNVGKIFQLRGNKLVKMSSQFEERSQLIQFGDKVFIFNSGHFGVVNQDLSVRSMFYSSGQMIFACGGVVLITDSQRKIWAVNLLTEEYFTFIKRGRDLDYDVLKYDFVELGENGMQIKEYYARNVFNAEFNPAVQSKQNHKIQHLTQSIFDNLGPNYSHQLNYVNQQIVQCNKSIQVSKVKCVDYINRYCCKLNMGLEMLQRFALKEYTQ